MGLKTSAGLAGSKYNWVKVMSHPISILYDVQSQFTIRVKLFAGSRLIRQARISIRRLFSAFGFILRCALFRKCFRLLQELSIVFVASWLRLLR